MTSSTRSREGVVKARLSIYLALWLLAAFAFVALVGLFSLPDEVSLLLGFCWGSISALFALDRWHR
jgi:hypothetical protein